METKKVDSKEYASLCHLIGVLVRNDPAWSYHLNTYTYE